jgi:hypothetical protein
MQWHTLIVLLVPCGLAGMGIWGYAYRLGFKHGQSTSVPFRLIDELLDHKIYCLGQDPAIARVELETGLGIAEWESQSLIQHILRGRNRENPGVVLSGASDSMDAESSG